MVINWSENSDWLDFSINSEHTMFFWAIRTTISTTRLPQLKSAYKGQTIENSDMQTCSTSKFFLNVFQCSKSWILLSIQIGINLYGHEFIKLWVDRRCRQTNEICCKCHFDLCVCMLLWLSTNIQYYDAIGLYSLVPAAITKLYHYIQRASELAQTKTMICVYWCHHWQHNW